MANETILVVDDSTEMLALLGQYMLTPLGYNVITVVDGEAGLQAALQHKPDLILLDMCMPRMTGLEMLDALRKTDCTSPVVFMTSYDSVAVAVEAFRMGVRDFLSKPFTLEEVQKAVDRALREARLEREHEDAGRRLLAAETVQNTVLTLCHYLNNYVMAIGGSLTLVEEAWEADEPDTDVREVIYRGKESLRRIQAVLNVLLRVTEIKQTPYSETSPMIDIAATLEEELERTRSARLQAESTSGWASAQEE